MAANRTSSMAPRDDTPLKVAVEDISSLLWRDRNLDDSLLDTTSVVGCIGEARSFAEQRDVQADKRDNKPAASIAQRSYGHRLPFPEDFQLQISDQCINVSHHLGPIDSNPGGVRCIVIMLPGVNAGVGPCRKPGTTYDQDALYPMLARRLMGEEINADVYRVSWAHSAPSMEYAVGGTCRVLHHALHQVAKRCKLSQAPPPAEVRVVIIGHSLGGAVALHAAEVVARHYGPGGTKVKGLKDTIVRMAGVCTLNSSAESNVTSEGTFSSLSETHAMMICGTADEVVSPRASDMLYEMLPSKHKRQLRLPFGTHCLYSYKDPLLEVLSIFVVEAGLK
mmetsp:Transcript_57788/g.148657  ORF Transcript_57788/g.148657 Transcript_57788/m.148657 type:complete len:336 (-) Transcript_57788:167-1174(-)